MKVLIVNPVSGGSGRCADQITRELTACGHSVGVKSSLSEFSIGELVRADLIILNEGLQGVRRNLLRLIRRLRGNQLKVFCIVRNFKFVKNSYANLENAIDRVFCVSRCLRDLFRELYPGLSEGGRLGLLIEPSIGEIPLVDNVFEENGLTTILVPRVYIPQQIGILRVANALAQIGYRVTVVRQDIHSNEALFGQIENPKYQIVPYQSDLKKLYDLGDAVLMGGGNPEGWGLIYNESLVYGKVPLILASSGGYVEQFLKCGVGCLCNPDDLTGAVDRFSRYLGKFSEEEFRGVLKARLRWIEYSNKFSYQNVFDL